MRASRMVFVGAILAPCSARDGASESADATNAELAAIPNLHHAAVCANVQRVGFARCHARVRTDVHGFAVSNTAPRGLTPADLAKAYKLPPSGGAGATIAIVDANDDPNAESDLAVHRAQFGLAPCTTANGCFKKVNQRGVAGSYPAADPGWAGEIALDLDMASAVCPSCKILLVEADDASIDNLGASVNAAAALGATVISNSYGGPEDSSITAASTKYFNHPGILITASTGESGYGVSFPASSPFVTAVRGTSLKAYEHTGSYFDATTGGNGSCGGSYLCTAKVGYDGLTGVGTPNGALLAAGGSPPPPVDAGPGSTCSHPICAAGAKLTRTCDPCAAQICAADAYCCGTRWDAQCVGEVNTICHQACP